MAKAKRIAYTSDGLPAYEGQALLIASCGGDSYCHTQMPRERAPRFGAPADLVFDPLPIDGYPDEGQALKRLFRAVQTIRRHRDAIYASVLDGSMPPRSHGRIPDLRNAASMFRRFADANDPEGVPLPSIQSPEGVEILHTWLACASPVVERTAFASPPPCRSDMDCEITRSCDEMSGTCQSVGDTVPRRDLQVEPKWSAIHSKIMLPSCAVSGCHRGPEAAAQLDLSDQASAYERLTRGLSSETCGRRRFVVPSRPDESLLVEKVGPNPSCGARMPPWGLGPFAVQAIVEWIRQGAHAD